MLARFAVDLLNQVGPSWSAAGVVRLVVVVMVGNAIWPHRRDSMASRKIRTKATKKTKKSKKNNLTAKQILIDLFGEEYIAHLTGLEPKDPNQDDRYRTLDTDRLFGYLTPWGHPPCSCTGCPHYTGKSCSALHVVEPTIPVCKKYDWIFWTFDSFDKIVCLYWEAGHRQDMGPYLAHLLNRLIEVIVPLIGFDTMYETRSFPADKFSLEGVYDQALNYGPASADWGVRSIGKIPEALNNGS